MRLELKAVEAAIRIRLALGGSLEEVTLLNMVPADTPGDLSVLYAVCGLLSTDGDITPPRQASWMVEH